METTETESPLVKAAKIIGGTAGAIASLTGTKEDAKADAPAKEPLPEGTYKAENYGSGTFQITKPKRKDAKRRQSALRSPRRGARK